MNAVILAGGRGSRLMPLTDDIPKPMLPVAGYPIIDYVIAQLAYYGIKEVVITLGYRGEVLEKHASHDKRINTKFFHEDIPLGTCGCVKNAEEALTENFIVMSGDCISDVDLGKMVERHVKSGALVTMATSVVADPCSYGVIESNDKGIVTRIIEKPGSADFGNTVNLGIYVINKRALKSVKKGIAVDFAKHLFPRLIEKGAVAIYRHDGFWSDLGDVKRYYEANKRFMSNEAYPFTLRGETNVERKGGNVVAKSAKVNGGAEGSIICGESIVSRGAFVRDCVVLGGEVRGSHFKRIIKNGTYVDV